MARLSVQDTRRSRPWRLSMLDVTAYSGRVLGVFVIVLVALGLGLYLRGRTSAQRSSDVFRWMAATAVAMIVFLVLGITYEDWFFLWFLLAGGILVVLAGVWIVLRWRRGTVPQYFRHLFLPNAPG